MITVELDGRSAVVTGRELMTSGSYGIQCQFTFTGDDWEAAYAKTAVFRSGDDGTVVDVPMVDPYICTIPYPVLKEAGEVLFIGVYGTDGSGNIIVPTVWASSGVVKQGVVPASATAEPPTPSEWDMMNAIATEANMTADAAMTKAEEAVVIAGGAEAQAERAKGYADSAAASAGDAGDSAAEAERQAGLAEGFAGTAQTAAGQASDSAGTASQKASAAATSASAASTSATMAGGYADMAEGFAKGTKGGVPDPAYAQSNAAYYAAQAQTAQDAIESMTATATARPEGSNPTVTKTTDPETGYVNLEFGIPKGDQGTAASFFEIEVAPACFVYNPNRTASNNVELSTYHIVGGTRTFFIPYSYVLTFTYDNGQTSTSTKQGPFNPDGICRFPFLPSTTGKVKIEMIPQSGAPAYATEVIPIVSAGVDGDPGEGVPTGGTTGQYLRKESSTDYDADWDTLTAGDVAYGTDTVADALEELDTVTSNQQTAIRSLEDGKAERTEIAPYEPGGTALHAHASGEMLYVGDTLYKANADISAGGSIVTTGSGKNVSETSVNDELCDVKNTLNHMENGVNENMTAGNAMQLNSNLYAEDQEPYLFRQTGGGVNAGTREIDTIVGGTVAWNQIQKHDRATNTTANVTYTNNNDGSFTLNGTANANSFFSPANGASSAKSVANHIYLAATDIVNPSNNSLTVGMYVNSALKVLGDTHNSLLYKATTTGDEIQMGFRWASGTNFSSLKVKGYLIDLTQMFGTAIADRAYALEQATAGSGIAWLKSMGFFTQDYYPSDTGTLKSVEGLQSHDMRDANDTVIASYLLDSDLTLRGIPKLDANNKLYYDGDTYEAGGSVTRRYGIVDLGTLTWTKDGNNTNLFRADALQGIKKYGNTNIICSAYITVNTALDAMPDRSIRGHNSYGYIYARDSTYATAWEDNAPDVFKSAMSGVYLVYELATPTTEIADPFQTPQICDPSGTEEYVTTGIVPVGHETKYPVDQVKKLDNLPSDLSFVGPIENGATCQNANGYLQGQYFVKNNQFCKAKTAIASGATFTLNTNYEVTTVAAELYAAINS